MDRRLLLRALPLLVAGLGGCVGGPRGDGGDSPRVTDTALQDTGRCSEPETASVTTEGATVEVRGCITGPNGCAVASLGSAALDDDGLEVIVTTERDAPPNVACTEALVYRGYEATVTVEDGRPGSVRVVHDAAGGERRWST
ncbi:hypothetical protein ACFQL0_02120 [Haloplanus litoreus]|uniref:hypothetical protein n=1 Tax=Haloplanus litoreus TaxID=767515 RepID=UPI00360FB94E